MQKMSLEKERSSENKDASDEKETASDFTPDET